MLNDIGKPRARKNNHWRALQFQPKISLFEPFFSVSKRNFWFFSLSVSKMRAQVGALHQKVYENIPCFRRVKIGRIEKILGSFENCAQNGKKRRNPVKNDNVL